MQEQGPHLYELQPSANFFDCKAMAIGARSQSARTYLERNIAAVEASTVEGLAQHVLRALRDCLPAEVELTPQNTTLCIVGADREFTIYEDDKVCVLF